MSNLFWATLICAGIVIYDAYRYWTKKPTHLDFLDCIFGELYFVVAVIALLAGEYLLFGSSLVTFLAELYFKFGLFRK